MTPMVCRLRQPVVSMLPTTIQSRRSFWAGKGDAKAEDTKSEGTNGNAKPTEAANGAADAAAAGPAAGAKETKATAGSASTATPAADKKTNGNGDAKAAPKKDEKSVGEIAREKEVAALTEKLKQREHQLSQLNDQWRAAVAEQDSVRRRAKIDIDNANKFGIQGFAKSLLEVADTLTMAAASVEKEIKACEGDEAIRESPTFQTLRQLYDGVLLTDKVLNKAFERNHVIKFDAMGAKFDPNVHDGIFQFDDATKPPGTVGAVMKAGYMLHDRVMRPATVGTIRGTYVAPAESTTSGEAASKTTTVGTSESANTGAQS